MKPFTLVLFAALAVSGAPALAAEGNPHERASADLSKAQPPPAAPEPTVAETAVVLVRDASTVAAPPDPGTAMLMIAGLLALGWLAGRH